MQLPNDYPYDEIDAVKPSFEIQMSSHDFKDIELKAFSISSDNNTKTYPDLYPGRKYHVKIEPFVNGEPSDNSRGRASASAIISCSCGVS